MKFSAPIQRLVEKAERTEKAKRSRRRQSAVVVASERWREQKRRRDMASAAKTRIELLRFNLKKAQEATRREEGALRARYGASRPKLAAEVRRFRAKWRKWVNEQVAELRRKHRAVWQGRLDAARLRVVKARLELEAERGYQKDIRATNAAMRKARKPSVAKSARGESDYRVEQNLPPELVPVWHKFKNRIRTSYAHKSRTEAFLEWVSENPGEVEAFRARQAEAAYDAIEDEMARYERELYGGR